MVGSFKKKLECDWTNVQSVTFKLDQSDFLLTAELLATAGGLLLVPRGDISHALTPRGELQFTAAFHKTLAKATRK